MSKIRDFFDRLRGLVDEFDAPGQERAWDGSASNYDSTEQYCAACLIDVNGAAGRDTKAQSHCMLPVKAPGSSGYDFEGVQAAAGGHGITQVKKPADVSQDAWDSAVQSAANAIISQYNANDQIAPDSVYEAAGKTPPERERAVAMSQVADQFWGLLAGTERWDAWPLDFWIDTDAGGEMYALVAERGKLYRVAMGMDGSDLTLGEWTEVETVHRPVQSRTTIRRQADGRYRWINISATATLNRVAEIDSRALFDDFIRRAQETGEYPKRDLFHCGEPTVHGQCDFLARDDAVFITSGVYDDSPLAQALVRAIEADPGKWGDSISYLPQSEAEMVEVADGVRVPVYNAGKLRYISTLPENRAASLYTTTRVQEVTRMRQEIKDLLLGLKEHGLPEDEIDKIEAMVDGTNREIQDGGVINRDAEPEPGGDAGDTPEPEQDVERAPEPESDAATDTQPREIVLDDEALGAIVDRVMAGEAVIGMQSRIEALEAENRSLRAEVEETRALRVKREADVDRRLVALERDDDQKKRDWQADLPERARGRTTVTYRPRENKATTTQGGEKPDLAAVAQQTLDNWPQPAK